MSHKSDVLTPGDSYCYTTISALDIFQEGQENLFILGDAFMQMFYTIFDRDNDRVGFGKSRIYSNEMRLNEEDRSAPAPFLKN